jgi:hypothetical protein
MTDMRFALLTTVIIAASYTVALTVASLDRVLAYVGSTGSTSISFILPGLFYYKISDPDSIHHQRLAKEDDDATADVAPTGVVVTDEAETGGPSGSGPSTDSNTLVDSGSSVASAAASERSATQGLLWRWRKRWRWDMEHIEPQLLRKMSLALAVYGMCVMAVCLIMNTFFVATH